MVLAEMSIDEAIALACREVPECDTVSEAWIKDEVYRALWFDAAWEWLHHDIFLHRHRPEIQDDHDGWCVRNRNGAEVLDQLPTKYHALAAAVLLAAGRVVP